MHRPRTDPCSEKTTWPRLLMGLGLASTTGSLIVFGASLLAGIAWWLTTQSESLSQRENNDTSASALNNIWIEAILGIGMFLLALMTFAIRTL